MFTNQNVYDTFLSTKTINYLGYRNTLLLNKMTKGLKRLKDNTDVEWICKKVEKKETKKKRSENNGVLKVICFKNVEVICKKKKNI